MASQQVQGSETGEGAVESLTELLAGLVGTAASLRLFKAAFAPTPLNVEADFEAAECDYAGYAAVPLTWSAVGLDTAGTASTAASRAFFQATDGTTPNLVGGAWVSVETAVGPPAVRVSLDYYLFPAPVPMSAALAWLALTLVKQQPSSPGYAVLEQ